MGRKKEEMKRIHHKKMKKAKEKVKMYIKKEITYSQLNKLAKKFLEKRIKSERSEKISK
ncbi:MAG: hypothetical protein NC817_00310 [Candidatus Omnitrophica bacterium]|nr:hypothetical protein [Candidatus Omnitrophota bacterium]MCM8823706.1 hypothetical protein [Candidatus Omnitrophota bacterium]MCM8827122.1 hypothetical protein [Candidatus Omnitrophota bacterium]